jgi:hypothetical protein
VRTRVQVLSESRESALWPFYFSINQPLRVDVDTPGRNCFDPDT